VDFWRVISLGSGICLFIMAPLFAHNIMFHYLTGVSVGIFGSLLVIVFLLSRLIPKKSGALAVLFGGWGLLVYFFQYFWSNCMSLLKEYQVVVVGYIFVAGLISFAVVYRFGPVSDKRSLKLVQWALQLTGFCLIFFSSQYREFTLAVIIILIINYNIPSSWKSKVKTFVGLRPQLRKFPPKRKLLSEEEYLEQSRVETKKALDDLREFCHSPECNAWKTMSRLNSPHRFAEKCNVVQERKVFRYQMQRFAEFVEGDFHLTDDEILSYESSSFPDRLRLPDEEELLTSDEEEVQHTSF
ncbi:Nuclear envelope integral membrane protein 1, partial [Armadillidium nasatum]